MCTNFLYLIKPIYYLLHGYQFLAPMFQRWGRISLCISIKWYQFHAFEKRSLNLRSLVAIYRLPSEIKLSMFAFTTFEYASTIWFLHSINNFKYIEKFRKRLVKSPSNKFRGLNNVPRQNFILHSEKHFAFLISACQFRFYILPFYFAFLTTLHTRETIPWDPKAVTRPSNTPTMFSWDHLVRP